MNQQQFLEEVRAGLRLLPPQEREQELAEIAAHLEASRDAARELGCADQEAEAEALRQFGVASDVARNLARAHMRRRWLTRGDGYTAALFGVALYNGPLALLHAFAPYVPLSGPHTPAAIELINYLDQQTALKVAACFLIGWFRPRQALGGMAVAALLTMGMRVACEFRPDIPAAEKYARLHDWQLWQAVPLGIIVGCLPVAAGVIAARLWVKRRIVRPRTAC